MRVREKQSERESGGTERGRVGERASCVRVTVSFLDTTTEWLGRSFPLHISYCTGPPNLALSPPGHIFGRHRFSHTIMVETLHLHALILHIHVINTMCLKGKAGLEGVAGRRVRGCGCDRGSACGVWAE